MDNMVDAGIIYAGVILIQASKTEILRLGPFLNTVCYSN